MAKQITRTYEGRVPARPIIEEGVLWIPVKHHIDGVFENRDTYTTITLAQAEGSLAEETLALADEYRALREQAAREPHPGEHFALEEMSTLPTWIGTPIERAGWQIYMPGDEIYASRPPTPDNHTPAYYRLLPKDATTHLREALDRFERAIVDHGHARIKLKQINDRMRTNTNALKRQLTAHSVQGARIAR